MREQDSSYNHDLFRRGNESMPGYDVLQQYLDPPELLENDIVYSPKGGVKILHSGEVALLIPHNAPNRILSVVSFLTNTPGTVLGGEWLADANIQPLSSILRPMSDDVYLHNVSYDKCHVLMEGHPHFIGMAALSLLYRTSQSEALATVHADLKLNERLILFLQQRAEEGVLQITHEGIAELLGVYRETVSGYLKVLRAKGIVKDQNYGRIQTGEELNNQELSGWY